MSFKRFGDVRCLRSSLVHTVPTNSDGLTALGEKKTRRLKIEKMTWLGWLIMTRRLACRALIELWLVGEQFQLDEAKKLKNRKIDRLSITKI